LEEKTMNNKIFKVGTIITGVLAVLGGAKLIFDKVCGNTEEEVTEEVCDCEEVVEDIDEAEEE
jgi:hypothetical protein